jgi:ribosomal protein L37AE/L43A
MWYERICDIPKKCLVADNWHQRSKEIDREAVAIAVQNCPQCGEQEFTSPAGVLNCFYCGWSIELSRYTFLHVPAKIINPKEEQARIDAAELEKKRQHAIGQLRTWARKCRERGFSDAVMWSAAFPEHAVPFGYELDSEGSLGQSVFHADEIAQLKAYLTSGMSFHDIAWELLAGFEDLRRRMIATGHAPEATHGR